LGFALLPELAARSKNFWPRCFHVTMMLDNTLRNQSAQESLVAASDLSCDDCWPQHAFGMVVGRMLIAAWNEAIFAV